MSVSAFRRFSIGVLAYTLVTIVWGALVRATGSGAGCGAHWPLCDGKLIPGLARLSTLIEFTHRAMSGLSLVSIVLLVIFAFRSHPSGSLVRKGALTSLFFILTEAALGAGLVLFRLVAENESMARAMFMSAHLINTFFLLAALSLTMAWSFGASMPRLKGQGVVSVLLVIGVLGLFVLGVSGAITALGDTLFPASSLAEGMRRDFSATAHAFLRLRVWHPVLAVLMGGYVTGTSMFIAAIRPQPAVKRASTILMVLFLCQLGIGVANLVLLAPIPVQLVHLLMADCVWIALVILAVAALSADAAPEGERSPVAPQAVS